MKKVEVAFCRCAHPPFRDDVLERPDHTMLRPRLRIPRVPLLGLARPSRSLHTVPELHYIWKEDGKTPGLLTKFGFDNAWTQYQSFILSKLNQLTTGVCPFPPFAIGPGVADY